VFVVDLSPSMAKTRTVKVPSEDGTLTVEMASLEWGLQYVKVKIQEMTRQTDHPHPISSQIYNGRKTDQCGVVTQNILNERGDGYEHVYEYIPIAQPNSNTIAKLNALRATDMCGDPIDALIVAIETQHIYLSSKKTWTRKIVILTDGESPIELDEWENTAQAVNDRNIALTIIGVDFDEDSDQFRYAQQDKSDIKRENERFYNMFASKLTNGIVGTCEFALQDISRPDIKTTRSALMGTTLRIGDVHNKPTESMEIQVKLSKCTAIARPKSWKRVVLRKKDKDKDGEEGSGETEDDTEGQMDVDEGDTYVELKKSSEYYRDSDKSGEDDDEEDQARIKEEKTDYDDARDNRRVEKEDLIKGFKYGSTYTPCPDGQFDRLETKKGIDICGFFKSRNFRRELAMGEVQYIWADPGSPRQQVALSSIVQGMTQAKVVAIGRMVSRDGTDPKMGVLTPCGFEKVDCLLWVQVCVWQSDRRKVPFADDVRKYTFPSLETVYNKAGEEVIKHPYLPTEAQQDAMDKFVEVMDLTLAGEKDENGDRQPWYDNRMSYNPAVHRIKQAMFHSAVITDLTKNPLPAPHPELTKYMRPPVKVVRRTAEAMNNCRNAMGVQKGTIVKATRRRKDDHVLAKDADDEMLLLDSAPVPGHRPNQSYTQSPHASSPEKKRRLAQKSGSDTEDEDDHPLLGEVTAQDPESANVSALPTPNRSASPDLEIDEREEGRIIGFSHPLDDWRKNIAEGDVVSKAVEDMGYVIREIINRPFAERRHGEMIECMREMRETCLREDEIDEWNGFMMDLREECLETDGGGNNAFWKEVCADGRTLSLISKTEAANAGGKSRISESVASEVGYKRPYVRLLLIRKFVTVRYNQVIHLKLKCIDARYRIASPPSRTRRVCM
ncbi:SPOC domain-like protein, partial [Thelephora ganbajun]